MLKKRLFRERLAAKKTQLLSRSKAILPRSTERDAAWMLLLTPKGASCLPTNAEQQQRKGIELSALEGEADLLFLRREENVY